MWKSSSDKSTPARRAMASRCTTAFVEPLSAASTLSALAKAAGVSMSRAERPSVAKAKATARRPVATPRRKRWPETAGGVAAPGSISPRASVTQAMVDAVPMDHAGSGGWAQALLGQRRFLRRRMLRLGAVPSSGGNPCRRPSARRASLRPALARRRGGWRVRTRMLRP